MKDPSVVLQESVVSPTATQKRMNIPPRSPTKKKDDQQSRSNAKPIKIIR